MTTLPEYQLNSVSLPAPTDGKWIEPSEKGTDGVGQTKYVNFFEFELFWSRITQEDFRTIYNAWLGHYGSGTATVRLPDYDGTTYAFANFTGVYVDRPKHGRSYDHNYVAEVRMKIVKITV